MEGDLRYTITVLNNLRGLYPEYEGEFTPVIDRIIEIMQNII